MSTRELGRKATVFMEKVQVLKCEMFYRPVFVKSTRHLVVSAQKRTNYWQDKFERAKQLIHNECYKNTAPKRLLGVIK